MVGIDKVYPWGCVFRCIGCDFCKSIQDSWQDHAESIMCVGNFFPTYFTLWYLLLEITNNRSPSGNKVIFISGEGEHFGNTCLNLVLFLESGGVLLFFHVLAVNLGWHLSVASWTFIWKTCNQSLNYCTLFLPLKSIRPSSL